MSSTVFIAILLVAGLVAVAVLFILLRKMNLSVKLAGHLAFWPVMIACIVVFTQSTSTYIVTAEGEKLVVTSQLGFGNATYEMESGEKVDVPVPAGFGIVINDTDYELMVEAVIYGSGIVREDDAYIEARSHGLFNSTSIDYYPDEEPPATIESSASGAEAKTWLHPVYDYSDYEYDESDYETEEPVDEESGS